MTPSPTLAKSPTRVRWLTSRVLTRRRRLGPAGVLAAKLRHLKKQASDTSDQ